MHKRPIYSLFQPALIVCFLTDLILCQYACTVSCGSGLKCCRDLKNDACYDPNEQQCIESRILCANFEQACGDLCFDPTTHICFQNEDGSGNILCGRGEAICKGQCFDPLQFNCFDDQISARANDTCTATQINTLVQCGSECFPPQNQSCVACRDPTDQLVCALPSTGVVPLCCATSTTASECYDPSQSFCCADPARTCPMDNSCTDGSCSSTDRCCSSDPPRVSRTPTRFKPSAANTVVVGLSSVAVVSLFLFV